jgi:hypothetical protein
MQGLLLRLAGYLNFALLLHSGTAIIVFIDVPDPLVHGICIDVLVSPLHAGFCSSGGWQSSTLPPAPGSSGR